MTLADDWEQGEPLSHLFTVNLEGSDFRNVSEAAIRKGATISEFIRRAAVTAAEDMLRNFHIPGVV